jgi:hypothetical protein
MASRQSSMYNIPRDSGTRYIGETSRPLEVCLKEHKYKLTQGLLEKSKLAKYPQEEDHNYAEKKRRSYRLNQVPHTENTGDLPTCLW